MTDLNDLNYVDNFHDVLAVYVNRILAATLRSEYKNIETLSADRTLLDADTPIQRLDCDGAARIVKVPVEDAVNNHPFFIVNASAGAYAITLKSNDGATIIATVTQGEAVLVLPDGDGTYKFAGDSAHITNMSNPHNVTAAQVGVVQETNAAELFRVAASPGGTSRWEGTFTAAGSSGSTIKYATTAGIAAIMTPFATSNLGKMRLYNTTRGNYVLISNHVAGTITSTADYPANWANGDVLTTNSQTVTFAAAGVYYVDIEITSGPTGKSALFVMMNLTSASVGDAMIIHPFSTYEASKVKVVKELVAGQGTNNLHLIKITSNVFCLNWQGTPTTVYVREQGYIT